MPKGIKIYIYKCHDHNTHIVAVHDDFLIYLEKGHYTCDLEIIVMYVIKDSSNKTI